MADVQEALLPLKVVAQRSTGFLTFTLDGFHKSLPAIRSYAHTLEYDEDAGKTTVYISRPQTQPPLWSVERAPTVAVQMIKILSVAVLAYFVFQLIVARTRL